MPASGVDFGLGDWQLKAYRWRRCQLRSDAGSVANGW